MLSKTATVAIVIAVLLLTIVPAYVNSLIGFAVGVAISLALTLYVVLFEEKSAGLRGDVVRLFFTGVLALGATGGIIMALPFREKLYSVVGIVAILPFLFYLAKVFTPILKNFRVSEFLSFGNGVVAFLIVVVIGALIGRALNNFYETIVLYTGFIVAGLLVMMYFRGGEKK